MIGLSHIALHLGLCSAIARQGPDTPIEVRVQLLNHTGRASFDKHFSFTRGYAADRLVEFDAPFGVYAMHVTAPKYGCSAANWEMVLPGHDRNIHEPMVEGVAHLGQPLLLAGTLPASFAYANPTVVAFDKGQACNTPVGDPLPVKTVVENDQDAFYVWMYPDPSLAGHTPVVAAVQIGAADGDDTYIRLKVPFPVPWHGFPDTWQFNVSENVIDMLSQQKTETLLCPRMYEAITH
ncbi:MAG: hypothetical protein KGN02_15305 [bacterium]|nr:hypothetical protein [bacterium]